MNSKERFYATIERKPVDRPAAWLGIPHPDSVPGLLKHYGVKSVHELKLAVGDDFYAVELPYHSPNSNAIYAAFDWYQDGKVDAVHRTLTFPGCFNKAEELSDLDFFKWPDPAKYVDPRECIKVAKEIPDDRAGFGVFWCCHFQDMCASFGMETALMNMAANPELVHAVDDKIVDFYLKAAGIFLETVCNNPATKNKINVILIGDDIGSQRGLMISRDMVREFVIPGAKKLIGLIHRYGLKVIYHSCGSIAEAIPDLIEAGVDAIHPIQAAAAGMSAEELAPRYADKVSFCGGVDTQFILPHGTADDVRQRVRELRKIFPTGLIISPSHEAIQPDVPPANIQALFEEATKVD
jgi:uroporphyrinogen decarboxylase